MAITDIARYTHLSREDIEHLGREVGLIRNDIEESLGARDATDIRRTIMCQRTRTLRLAYS